MTLGRVTGSGGTNTANAAVKVYQSSNTDWTAKFVNGGGSGYGILIQTGAGAETPLISAMDNYGNSRMYLSTTGKLGIGTTQPTEKLDVVGNIQLSTFPARLGVAVADTFTYDGMRWRIMGYLFITIQPGFRRRVTWWRYPGIGVFGFLQVADMR